MFVVDEKSVNLCDLDCTLRSWVKIIVIGLYKIRFYANNDETLCWQ